jgi:AcrR family transcriptional regulator
MAAMAEMHTARVPRLWSESINTHRQMVRDAVLDAVAGIAERDGLLALTMSRIAEASGIGRATLYKYFPDIAAVVTAWHERQIEHHVATLGELAAAPADAASRLEAVLEGYAMSAYHGGHQHTPELAVLLHADARISRAHDRVHELLRQLIVDSSRDGQVRDDVDPGELAAFALHALSAAGTLRSRPAVKRLVRLTMTALRHR